MSAMTSKLSVDLSSLLSSSTIDDHEEVLKQAIAELKKDKANQDAMHTRVVALLKLDRFDDALRALDDGGDKLAERCALEKAYALYKTGQLEDAAKIADTSDTKSRGIKHIAAQVAYRAENFQYAAKIYKDLNAQASTIEGEENDLRINSSAVDVQLEWQGNGEKAEKNRKKTGREDLEGYETSYNAACGCIARGDLGAGSVLLKRARDLCEALDELSDEEKKAEVLPIMVQQAYVFTRMGKLEEAEALQKMINIPEYVSHHYFVFTTNHVPIVFRNSQLELSPTTTPLQLRNSMKTHTLPNFYLNQLLLCPGQKSSLSTSPASYGRIDTPLTCNVRNTMVL